MLVPSLLNELRADLFASESEILTSRDYAELVNILDELTKVLSGGEWMRMGLVKMAASRPHYSSLQIVK